MHVPLEHWEAAEQGSPSTRRQVPSSSSSKLALQTQAPAPVQTDPFRHAAAGVPHLPEALQA